MGKTNARGRAGACILALAAMAAAASAHADDGAERSIDSAQEFLSYMLPGNHYVSTPMSEILARARREGLRAHFEPLPVIYDADPVHECRSMLLSDIRGTEMVVRDPATGDTAVSELAELMQDDVIGSSDGFHFGHIRKLGQSGPRVFLRFAGEQVDAVLHLEGEEVAARVHAAFDYLRRHCDPAAATGF